MTAATLINLARKTARCGEGFARSTRGMVAIEFALIVPVMITIYFGTIETTNAMTAARRVTNVAQTAADLTAQAASVSTSDINDIFAASVAILTPFPTSPVKITITSIVASSSSATTLSVAWSKTYNGATARTAAVLPSGLTTAGSSVIMVEVTYTYTSPIATFITGPIVMKETAYLKPRRSVTVPFTS
ncbi:MAG: pilus assembly protein [Parvibaculum sp.]|uniref:TadE/TadG family type IV pilus assembly protein n=1 Tax=Parvibaculum sp. TaxID=2024848 RepID=UPI0025E8379D|nr:TadE/TadG family type IV pilus assembly protein [Parvibaculum sp.]MCE9650595.1 pilus assembly protein [Parvibaculum sp.]